MGILDLHPPQHDQGQQPQQIVEQPVYQQDPFGINPLYQQQQYPMPSDVLRERLNTDDILDNLEHDLKGEYWDGKKWTSAYGRWINDKGVAIIKSVVARYTNKIGFLGSLKRDEIAYKCCSLKKELAKLLFNKYREYDIDKEKRSLLLRNIIDAVHMALSRSEDGLENHNISQSSNQQHIIHENKDNNMGRGLLSWLPFNRNKGYQ